MQPLFSHAVDVVCAEQGFVEHFFVASVHAQASSPPHSLWLRTSQAGLQVAEVGLYAHPLPHAAAVVCAVQELMREHFALSAFHVQVSSMSHSPCARTPHSALHSAVVAL